ncbi:NAD(P)/FAD-dependent oxidoreductase [Cryptosporangium phraense]|uniref:FAD-dependent oxidoreductase n=1 Tax=Cryptosporangium phraense TaxID=2593070 RepID=A0A545ALY6_9ACTN|nr:FAD-dependent oxidoreductase [Cryptosporangium phraense]TQS41735.1 FAD-dependent oxidoreductase [Cryptosporangium phraense]
MADSVLSLWLDGLAPAPTDRRAGLTGDLDVDVVIVGAGFTGLWTAYYLAEADPELRIAVLEAEFAGFGASGRNGGWCSALFPASTARIAREHGRDAAVALRRALFATVDEVGRVAHTEGLDIDWAKGGTLTLAAGAAQEERLRAELAEEREWGFGEDDYRWLSAEEARTRVGVATGVRGALYTPHCAAIHPAKLARGLASKIEARGVRLFEGTRVLKLEQGRAVTEHGTVTAGVVIRATEGYTSSLPGYRRTVAPLYSLMIATEPLPAWFFDSVGWRARETLTDGRHLIIYAQRTADDRIALGGRGAPYPFGSKLRPEAERDQSVFAALHRTLLSMFPGATGAAVTHTWGGPLGVPRDWHASVGLDESTGLGWAGGYVGDGVSTTNLAGRTLADLVLKRDTELTKLPWVGHRSPLWEPEPFRWLGMSGGLWAMTSADKIEARTGHRARRASAMQRLLGG